MQALEDVLGSRVNIQILRFLTGVRGSLSGNEIATRLGLRQSSARQALERLVKTGIVTRTDVGRTAAYELDHELDFSNAVLAPLFDAEIQGRRNVVNELAKNAPSLSPRPKAIILFGSLARGGRGFRDADLLCLTDKTADKSALHDSVAETFDRVQRRFGLPVNAVVATETQLRSARLASLRNEVKRDGILIFGDVPRIFQGIKVWKLDTQGRTAASLTPLA